MRKRDITSILLSLSAGAVTGGLTLATLTSFRPHWTFDPLFSMKRSWVWVQPSRAPAQATMAKPSHRGHSHNDFQQSRPLEDAIDRGFASVEADVRLRDGEVWVSHLGVSWSGTLEELYLKPLRKRAETSGSVRGDGKPFYLWIDLKEGTPELIAALQSLLARYSSTLTRYEGRNTIEGPVTVVFTGNGLAKRKLVRQAPARFGCQDNFRFNESDPSGDVANWCWYSINWFDEFEWDGEGEMPHMERLRLKRLIRRIHSKGRKVRLWGIPDRPECWRELQDADADLIGTDAIKRFGEYF